MHFDYILNYPPTSFVDSLGWFLLGLLFLWDVVWKAIGLWRAGRNNQVWWFLAILIFNTIGILPILYIFFFSPDKKEK